MKNQKGFKKNQKELKKLKPFKLSPCNMIKLTGGDLAKGGFAVGGLSIDGGCPYSECPWYSNCPIRHLSH